MMHIIVLLRHVNSLLSGCVVTISKQIPFYDLYGEAFSKGEPGYVHIEDIDTRSRGLDWEIAPHRHARLAQIVCVFNNSWRVEMDEQHYELAGNWLVLIPAGVVHSFHFSPDTQVFVLSVNQQLVAGSEYQQTAQGLVWQPQTIELIDSNQTERLTTYIGLLKREMAGAEPGQGFAISQLLPLILLTIARQQRLQDLAAGPVSRELRLMLNFRQLIEQHYSQHWSVNQYAEKLHVSVSTLNRLCQSMLNTSPKAAIHQRLISEAKRRLVYTTQTVEEISLTLGYRDPAYFSRFFKQTTGVTAGQFRTDNAN